jgi:periplasmic protein CpxP/Spy
MTTILSSRLASVAVAALLTLPAAAVAQSSTSPAAVPHSATAPAAASSPLAGHPVAGKNAEERVEQRIDELHAQLHITPAEQQQWVQFAAVMRENARDMDQAWMQRAQRFQSMNAVQNMQSYEQIAQQHAERLQKLVPAFEKLYEAMPDRQKLLADQVFRANGEQRAQHAAESPRGRSG